jgi:nitroimidazol reductase NimA-like FMN-containing flavoprotein (pyridoxamine 5'-phosphate oxidase superfamily)
VLAVNDQVCFEVDEFTDTLDDYASVLVEGRLVTVADVQEKSRAKLCNDEKYNRLRRGYRRGHGRSTPIEQLPLRKLLVDHISGRKKDSQPRATLFVGEGI